MEGWFGRSKKSGNSSSKEDNKEIKGEAEYQKHVGKSNSKVVVDGREIRELVENKEAFSSFVDHKFHELDRDRDGKLSVKELQPAVADIGAALGLPAQGASTQSDHIYSEVLSEFTHGKQDKVSKSEFQEVLTDILLGMAAGLKRDPIVILRIDGEDLKEFVESPRFEPEAIAVFSQLESENAPLRECLKRALQQLTVEHGMPPASDPLVVSKIVEPALSEISANQLEQPASQEAFLEEFKKLLNIITRRLLQHPVIVAHTENTFDGSGVKRLLSNKFELDKLLDSVWREVPKDRHHKSSKEYLRVALDSMAPSANLPPYGAVDQVDAVVNEAFKMVQADDGKIVDEAEFKQALTEILGSIMLQLEGTPIFISSNTVVHEPHAPSTSTLLPVAAPPNGQEQ
ncbi:uncharacterized protein LOC109713957 [Ananas comosus]|uniref:Uncharacterized protein LOC109713957 n=1 Tax=Ananas comosus TaxID=4615 RepID=A0A199VR19_ANACO|nr:uncharacterized protein LOC109713957 [Ananas comosus]XP_020093867.1 uncharacterized protein LOC109713957 [Ananas comosus]OAY79366.1 hypothetical protein ACMD2_17495 [Ananas comosus]